MLPEDDYKTFEELAEYAAKRAAISARRQGHQEWAYWIGVSRWAAGAVECDPLELFKVMKRGFDAINANSEPQAKAAIYAKLVHLRKMLRRSGTARQIPTRLSLEWLRCAAKVEKQRNRVK